MFVVSKLILTQPFYTNHYYVVLSQLNEVCQGSSMSSETSNNKTADFHNQITLSNCNKFQFNGTNSGLNRFATNVFSQ